MRPEDFVRELVACFEDSDGYVPTYKQDNVEGIGKCWYVQFRNKADYSTAVKYLNDMMVPYYPHDEHELCFYQSRLLKNFMPEDLAYVAQYISIKLAKMSLIRHAYSKKIKKDKLDLSLVVDSKSKLVVTDCDIEAHIGLLAANHRLHPIILAQNFRLKRVGVYQALFHCQIDLKDPRNNIKASNLLSFMDELDHVLYRLRTEGSVTRLKREDIYSSSLVIFDGLKEETLKSLASLSMEKS